MPRKLHIKGAVTIIATSDWRTIAAELARLREFERLYLLGQLPARTKPQVALAVRAIERARTEEL